MSELHLAAAQAASIRGDVAANLDHHLELAERAAAKGARVVVFPELSLTGYELDLAEALAFAEGDPRLDPLRRLAAERGVTLLVGAPARLDSGLHIAAFVIGPSGPERVYTKRHLHGEEHDFFVAGERDPRIDCGGRSAAVAICADTSEPAHAEAAALSGASVYLAGAFFPTSSYARNVERLEGYAVDHRMVVVLANSAADATGLTTAGGSTIWSDAGHRVAHLAGCGPGLAIAHFDDDEEAGWTGESVRLEGPPARGGEPGAGPVPSLEL